VVYLKTWGRTTTRPTLRPCCRARLLQACALARGVDAAQVPRTANSCTRDRVSALQRHSTRSERQSMRSPARNSAIHRCRAAIDHAERIVLRRDSDIQMTPHRSSAGERTNSLRNGVGRDRLFCAGCQSNDVPAPVHRTPNAVDKSSCFVTNIHIIWKRQRQTAACTLWSAIVGYFCGSKRSRTAPVSEPWE